jgi:autotransporter translocation and assembly factor TamB
MQRIDTVNGRIRLTTDAVIVEHMGGSVGKGRIVLTGRLDHEWFKPGAFTAQIVGDGVPLQPMEGMALVVESVLNLQGDPKNAAVAGRIRLIEGEYTKDVRIGLFDRIGPVAEKRPRSDIKSRPAYLERIALDVVVDHLRPFVVDNNLALLTVKPDLHITGTAGQPVVTGRAEVASGILTYQHREFTVEKGVFDFVDPYRIDPEIQIQAAARIRRWSIMLTASGSADDLRLQLRSTPPLQDQDIVSLLAFGKTASEIIEAKGGSPRSPQQMLADLLAREVAVRMKDSAALDRLELEYREAADPAESDEVRITVGRQLSRRTSVHYRVTARSGEAVHRLMADYKLLEKLIISTFQDTRGTLGGELRFRLEFR